MTRELTPVHRLHLEAIADQTDYPKLATTGGVAQYVYDHSSGPKMLYNRPPWHGLREIAAELESLGYVEIHVGAAKFIAPGAPTPEAQNVALSLTDAGQGALGE